MILNGCSLKAGPFCMSFKTFDPKSCSSVSAGIPCLPSKDAFSCSRRSWAPHQNLISCLSKGMEIFLGSWLLSGFNFEALMQCPFSSIN